jgi:hypothetical protein
MRSRAPPLGAVSFLRGEGLVYTVLQRGTYVVERPRTSTCWTANLSVISTLMPRFPIAEFAGLDHTAKSV